MEHLTSGSKNIFPKCKAFKAQRITQYCTWLIKGLYVETDRLEMEPLVLKHRGKAQNNERLNSK